MNDKLTISTAQLLAIFPDEGVARHYIWLDRIQAAIDNSK